MSVYSADVVSVKSAHRLFEVHVLGKFSVTTAEGPLSLTATSVRLVALLALHNEPLERRLVGGLLCGDRPATAAAHQLRTAIWRLGQLAPGLVETAPGHLGLGPDVRVDVREVRDRLVPLVYGDDLNLDDAPYLLGLVGDVPREVLPGWDDPWVAGERQRIKQLCVHALERFAYAYLAADDGRRGLLFARAAAALDPLRDTAEALLIRALVLTGDRAEAVEIHRAFRLRLAREWAIDPAPTLAAPA